jgi:hypothetical protein
MDDNSEAAYKGVLEAHQLAVEAWRSSKRARDRPLPRRVSAPDPMAFSGGGIK